MLAVADGALDSGIVVDTVMGSCCLAAAGMGAGIDFQEIDTVLDQLVAAEVAAVGHQGQPWAEYHMVLCHSPCVDWAGVADLAG